MAPARARAPRSRPGPAGRPQTPARRRTSSRSGEPSSRPRGRPQSRRRQPHLAGVEHDVHLPAAMRAQAVHGIEAGTQRGPVLDPASTWKRQRLPAATACSTSTATSESISASGRGGRRGADRHGGDVDQVRIAPHRAAHRAGHRLARWRQAGEMPALRRREHAAPGLLRRHHDVDDRAIRLGSARCSAAYSPSVPDGVSTTSTPSRPAAPHASRMPRLVAVLIAPIERNRACGRGPHDQLLPQRLGCGVGLG